MQNYTYYVHTFTKQKWLGGRETRGRMRGWWQLKFERARSGNDPKVVALGVKRKKSYVST